MTQPQLTKLHILFAEAGIMEREEYLEYVHGTIGHPVTTTKELTRNEAHICIEMLTKIVESERSDS